MWRYLICVVPTFAFAQVEQGAPNADFSPEFVNQTRAPALPATSIDVRVFADDLDRPWGIATLPGGQFLVTERSGTMRVVGSDGSVSGPISGLPQVRDDGQGGLLDVAYRQILRKIVWFSGPIQTSERWRSDGSGRGQLSSDGKLSDVSDIFVQTDPNRGGRHFGNRDIPMADGTVWVTTGDRGAGTVVQDRKT